MMDDPLVEVEACDDDDEFNLSGKSPKKKPKTTPKVIQKNYYPTLTWKRKRTNTNYFMTFKKWM